MNSRVNKTSENKSQAVPNGLQEVPPISELTSSNNGTSQITHLQEKLEGVVLQAKFEPVQEKTNDTGLPNNLKSGVENLSGYSMDNVEVHYNSDQPAQIQAHAYAQGTEIHVAPGQEKHLPHESWKVVQQRQGRTKPAKQTKENIPINDDSGLEKEADEMGSKAVHLKFVPKVKKSK